VELHPRGNANTSKTYDQNIVGTALSWKPTTGLLRQGGLVSKLHDHQKVSVNDYFAGDAWGLEYFAGYTFPVGQYALKSVQPYFMGDRIEYVNGRNYLRTDNGVGISFSWITVSVWITNTSSPPAPTIWAT
jgi:hypothetical protein